MKLIAAGREAPEAFLNKAEVHEHLIYDWIAFHELASERQIGMAIGPIPRSAIRDYAIEHEITGDDWDRFHHIIRAMDSEYLTLINTKTKDKPFVSMAKADDIEGVKGVFHRLEQRGKRGKRPQQKPTNGNQY